MIAFYNLKSLLWSLRSKIIWPLLTSPTSSPNFSASSLYFSHTDFLLFLELARPTLFLVLFFCCFRCLEYSPSSSLHRRSTLSSHIGLFSPPYLLFLFTFCLVYPFLFFPFSYFILLYLLGWYWLIRLCTF